VLVGAGDVERVIASLRERVGIGGGAGVVEAQSDAAEPDAVPE
jgi:hypothetical protein